jgi:hypothetical protein
MKLVESAQNVPASVPPPAERRRAEESATTPQAGPPSDSLMAPETPGHAEPLQQIMDQGPAMMPALDIPHAAGAQDRRRSYPKQETADACRQRLMMTMIPVLAIVMIFVLHDSLGERPAAKAAERVPRTAAPQATGGAPRTDAPPTADRPPQTAAPPAADQAPRTDAPPAADQAPRTDAPPAAAEVQIVWQVPARLAWGGRDPMQLTPPPAVLAVEGEGQPVTAQPVRPPVELIVTGILYSTDRPSALVNTQIVHEGQQIAGIAVEKIDSDGIQFERDGQRWKQGLNP